ncbi:hypothetical protein KM176_22295 [Pseudooceanicola sp. CBS1P-1]|uniref:Uncharacterized protein n=1 Tax=Pseudooceanicola albus TaxID=2692189 RepID=A0A6L7GAM2_9RHOB|nr:MULTISPECIES: hypothetical protein [Pseudooceanicola]MBT9386606.1 hypothetical protein [Pseudooceanicola endophyticus]MXN20722.1 hypothetical protein [Pseudooceanicola albus]
MTNNSSNQGYVALYVARNALGTAEQISFLNRDAGYGRLCDATVYTAPGPQLGPEQHWTSLPDVLPTLLAILKDRGDLAIVADFQDLKLDKDDLPAVLLHSCTAAPAGPAGISGRTCWAGRPRQRPVPDVVPPSRSCRR